MAEKINSRSERHKHQKNTKRKPKQNVFKKMMMSILMLSVFLIIAGIVTVFIMIKDAPELDEKMLKVPLSSTIITSDNEEITLDSGERRTAVEIQDVPPHVQNAFIAVEDVRFREHHGVDPKRIFGAVVANVKDGYGSEGASTITQQVIKLSFLTPEKTIKRKVQEQYLAIQLEQNFSKDQILEMYINKIYFSQGAYGVATAAKTYFNKEIDELTIDEAALLAGIPQRPSYYDPVQNPEAAKERRNLVINQMEKYQFITKEEAQIAKEKPLHIEQPKEKAMKYNYFIDKVLDELEQTDGINKNDIYNGGLKIYTTLDTKAQETLDEILNSEKYVQYPNEKLQAGVALIDTKTGRILALGGGRHQESIARGFNRSDNARQPGSTIKPILAYGPAIEYLKWPTAKIVKDSPHSYSSGQSIRNWNNSYAGDVTIRESLKKSLNIPAVKTFQKVGADKAKVFAEGLGIPIDKDYSEPYVLGGFTHGVSPIEMAGAFAAFGNNGVYNEPHTVTKIVYPDGQEIDLTPESEQAMHDYTAYMVTDMLKDVVRSGTGTRANISGLPVAGKTGTTNFSDDKKMPDDAVPDAWFTGYTTNYSISVWTGYDKATKELYLDGKTGSRISQQIFKALMTEVSKNQPTSEFTQPKSVVRVTVNKTTGLKAAEGTPDEFLSNELFVRGTVPKEVSPSPVKELKAPTVKAEYNIETKQLNVSWSYDGKAKSFKVQQSINGQTTETTTTETTLTIPNPTPEATYSFTVIAVDEELEKDSPPGTVSIKIPVEDVEKDDEKDDENAEEEEKKREEEEKLKEEEQKRLEEEREREEEKEDESKEQQPNEPVQEEPSTPPPSNEQNPSPSNNQQPVAPSPPEE